MGILPALLCILIMAYIIYLEFKNPKFERDLFVDLSISIIILIVSIYSMYELKFDFTKKETIAYVVLSLIGIFYICLVVYNEKHPRDISLKIVENDNEEDKTEVVCEDTNKEVTSEEQNG